MAKASSPIRLQEELMQAATDTARRYHRSTAEQIEYWADMGRQTAEVIDPDVLVSLLSGLARIKVEPVKDISLEPDEIFNALESDRVSGVLENEVTSSSVKYQISESYPGYLEQVDSTGKNRVGQFKDGVFTAIPEVDD